MKQQFCKDVDVCTCFQNFVFVKNSDIIMYSNGVYSSI